MWPGAINLKCVAWGHQLKVCGLGHRPKCVAWGHQPKVCGLGPSIERVWPGAINLSEWPGAINLKFKDWAINLKCVAWEAGAINLKSVWLQAAYTVVPPDATPFRSDFSYYATFFLSTNVLYTVKHPLNATFPSPTTCDLQIMALPSDLPLKIRLFEISCSVALSAWHELPV